MLGPNGAGKTTTLSMLSTLLPPTRGDVVVFGASVVEDPAEVRRRVGLAPQQISLYPMFTAQENLDFFATLHGVPSDVRQQRIGRLLDLVGLAPRRHDRVDTYSGGMQRRLNLACAMIHEPLLLLLDEPTANVDPQSRENLFGVIRQIASEGTTIVYTTHYIEEAERLCDRIAILDEGNIAAVGTLRELLGLIGMGEIVELRGRGVERIGRFLEARPEVVKVERDDGVLRLFVKTAADARALMTAPALSASDDIESLEVHRVSLERVFMHLTGKELRD
jgi:ABC-2 type transport system ATP-binding protein